VAIEEEVTVTNRRHVAVVAGCLSLVLLAAVMFVATTDVQAQAAGTTKKAQPGMTAKPKITPMTLLIPDLVILSITRTGNPTPAGSSVEVPVTVVVKNQGNGAAGAFKVSTEFAQAGGAPFAVAFSVPGQTTVWYPRATGLNAGSTISFSGKVLFLSSIHGAVSVTALADSCSGEEFTEAYCHVRESNENNNRSTPLAVTLP
jgi:hypothetical protein